MRLPSLLFYVLQEIVGYQYDILCRLERECLKELQRLIPQQIGRSKPLRLF